MRKLLLSILFVFCAVIVANAGSKFWNFSDDNFKDLKDITTEMTVDGLTIYGAAGTISVEANAKSMDDYNFTHRLKLGGGGFDSDGDEAIPTKRYLSFAVSGNASITVYGMSSSGSADRSMIVSDGEKIIGEGTILGASLTKLVINYEGPAATLYIYSRDSGINLYGIIAEEGESGGNEPIGQDIFWNFSDDQFNALGSVTTEITVDGLTINGTNGSIDIDTSNKSMDDYSFTHRIKLGGGGFDSDGDEAIPTKRYLSFDVSGKATITIYGMSSNNNDDRRVILSDGEEIIGEETLAKGPDMTKVEITYEGPATTLYVYSRNSGINFYGIGVAYGTGSGINLPNVNKAVQSIHYYDLTGKEVRSLPKGIFIEKTIYEDGTFSSKKIIKTQLN